MGVQGASVVHNQEQRNPTADPQSLGGQIWISMSDSTAPPAGRPPSQAENRGGEPMGNAASHRLRTWAWGRCDCTAALHPKRMVQKQSEASSPWLQQRVCFRNATPRFGTLTRFGPRRAGAAGPASSKPSTSSSGTRCMTTKALTVDLETAAHRCL